ncbi:MAG: HupE/UreJ family protein [Hyphomicrobiaceae bacterium]
MNGCRIYIAAAVLMFLTCAIARSHEGGVTGFASINIDRNVVQYKLTLSSIPDGPLAQAMGAAGKSARPKYELLGEAIAERLRLVANAGSACQPGPRHVTPPNRTGANLTAQVDFVCHRKIHKLMIRDDVFDVLGNDIHILARITWSGGSQQFVFRPEARETTIILAGAGSASSEGHALDGVESFFALGIRHILTGYDHLLFLLALIIGGGSIINVIKIVTGFTVGHSITLALAALDVVNPPTHLVEALIALSIAYVAAENLLPRYAISRRWAVSLAFGGVHGLGFSSVLRESGLAGENLLSSLFSFNVGVEVGQAAMVLVAMPILIRLRDTDWGAKATMILSVAILIVSLVLFAVRAFILT